MKHIKKSLLGLALTMGLLLPAAFALAAEVPVGSSDPSQGSFQLVPCTGVASSTNGTAGKECTFQDLVTLFQRIISFLLYLSIPLVLGMIMFTAFRYLTANGDPGKLASAKKMLVPVAIGIFWVLGAWIVVNTFLNNLLTKSQADANAIYLKTLK